MVSIKWNGNLFWVFRQSILAALNAYSKIVCFLCSFFFAVHAVCIYFNKMSRNKIAFGDTHTYWHIQNVHGMVSEHTSRKWNKTGSKPYRKRWNEKAKVCTKKQRFDRRVKSIRKSYLLSIISRDCIWDVQTICWPGFYILSSFILFAFILYK